MCNCSPRNQLAATKPDFSSVHANGLKKSHAAITTASSDNAAHADLVLDNAGGCSCSSEISDREGMGTLFKGGRSMPTLSWNDPFIWLSCAKSVGVSP